MFSAKQETIAFDLAAKDEDSRRNPQPPAPRSGMTNDVFDLETLNAFEELPPADGSNLMVERIDLYLFDAARRVSQIREASVATDWLVLKQAAHKLKGRSDHLGVRKVADICQKLEWMDRHDSPQTVAALVRLLEYESAMAHAALASVRQGKLD